MVNKDKNRKSEAQEIFEQADNAGRFAGDDADARAAREQAMENIRQDTSSDREERPGEERERRGNTDSGDVSTDREAHRDPAQSHDYKGEAQNVNDDTERPLNEDELEHSRNKATEGMRQGRDHWEREQKSK